MACLVPPKRKFENAPRIIYGRAQECLPSAVLSLYPEGPKVPFRISSLGPCEPAIVPQEAPILELLRWSAALSDPLRVVQAGAAVVALDFLPLGAQARALIITNGSWAQTESHLDKFRYPLGLPYVTIA
jgi:hypothetical protein